MSFEHLAWATTQKCESAAEKLILVMLASHTNGHTGQCNPSHEKLAEECSMSERATQNHLKKLETRGLITVQRNIRKTGQTSNQYTLNITKTSTGSVDKSGGVKPKTQQGGVQILHPGGAKNDKKGVQILHPKQEVKQELNLKRKAIVDNSPTRGREEPTRPPTAKEKEMLRRLIANVKRPQKATP